MIEAMACGTPVLAFRNGAVREVIDEGVTGYVVASMHEAVRALEQVLALDRGRVRQRFEERFCVSRMARDYVSVYERLIGELAGRLPERAAPTVSAKANGGGVAH
jgi:glycosyltransferase involved in cell wall biosynthesis